MAEFRKIISDVTEKKYLILLVLLGVIVLSGALDVRPIAGGDETRVAGIGAEYALEGSWIVPRLNGKPFLEYPPCFYWLEALFFRIFGICDFSAKLPSAIGGFLMIFSVFGIARRFRESAFSAFFCSAMLLFSAQFFEKTRCCMVDALLAGFVSLAVWMFIECVSSGKAGKKILFFLLFSVSCGLSVFTKGLIGIVLPCAMLGSWLLAADLLQKRFSFQKYLLLGAGVLAGLLIPCAWLCGLYLQEGYSAVYEVVVTNNFGRFTGAQGDHVESYFYYLKKLPGQFAPWTVLLPFALFYHGKLIWKEKKDFSLFTLCALLVPYVLLTLSASKRQVYLLPLYPMEALLIGSMTAKLLSGEIVFPFALPQKVQKLLFFLCAFLLIAGGCVLLWMAQDRAILYPLLAILCGGSFLMAVIRKNLCRGLLALLFGTALLLISADAGPLYNKDGKKAYFLFFAELKGELLKSPARVVLASSSAIERMRGACVYYLGHTVPVTDHPQKGDLVILLDKRKPVMKRIE